MRAQEGVSFNNLGTGDTAGFALNGGVYGIVVNAGTWSSGGVALTLLAEDGITQVATGTSLSADGIAIVTLPPGEFQLAVTAATGVYARITRVPTE